MIITSDFRLLERIFRNLLSNAIKYTKKGGIRIRVKEELNIIKLSVIDTGSGIHPSMKKKIFDYFISLSISLSFKVMPNPGWSGTCTFPFTGICSPSK